MQCSNNNSSSLGSATTGLCSDDDLQAAAAAVKLRVERFNKFIIELYDGFVLGWFVGHGAHAEP